MSLHLRFPIRTIARDSRGVTILELLIGMSLLIVVLGASYEFLMTGQRAALTTRDSFQAQSQLRSALDNLVDEIRWADSVTAASATSVTVHIPQNTPFSLTSPYSVTFAYDATNRTVTRQQGAGPIEPVAYNIVKPDNTAGLTLSYYRADATLVDLTVLPIDYTSMARVRLTIVATTNRTSRTFVGDASLRGR